MLLMKSAVAAYWPGLKGYPAGGAGNFPITVLERDKSLFLISSPISQAGPENSGLQTHLNFVFESADPSAAAHLPFPLQTDATGLAPSGVKAEQ